MMMIALTPAIYHHSQSNTQHRISTVKHLTNNSNHYYYCCRINLTGIVSDFQNGLMSIFTDAEAGRKAYLEQIDNASKAGGEIRNLPAIVFNSLS